MKIVPATVNQYVHSCYILHCSLLDWRLYVFQHKYPLCLILPNQWNEHKESAISSTKSRERTILKKNTLKYKVLFTNFVVQSTFRPRHKQKQRAGAERKRTTIIKYLKPFFMHHESELTVNERSIFGDIVSWLFGSIVLAIGVINTLWGNDHGYGVFIFLLSFVYFPPATAFLKKITGISIPLLAKIILGLFILWSALGVAELFDKIEMMRNAF
jgi:hypothetical protein